jgi:hypothetical protein
MNMSRPRLSRRRSSLVHGALAAALAAPALVLAAPAHAQVCTSPCRANFDWCATVTKTALDGLISELQMNRDFAAATLAALPPAAPEIRRMPETVVSKLDDAINYVRLLLATWDLTTTEFAEAPGLINGVEILIAILEHANWNAVTAAAYYASAGEWECAERIRKSIVRASDLSARAGRCFMAHYVPVPPPAVCP